MSTEEGKVPAGSSDVVTSFVPDWSKPQVVFCVGCMFSGKTDLLIKWARDAQREGGLVLLAYKPEIDTRTLKSEIVSRSGSRMECTLVQDGQDLLRKAVPVLTKIKQLFGERVHVVVAIDEAQFIDGIQDAVFVLRNTYRCIVILAGLLGTKDLDQGTWSNTAKLLPYCEHI